MRASFFMLIATIVALPYQLQAQADPKVVKAYESGVKTENQFRIVSDFIKSSKEDSRWREVAWMPDLWEGIQASTKLKKPIFIWAMNGDPLGCV